MYQLSRRTGLLAACAWGFAGAIPYMAHCHILEHEDSSMMAQFAV